MTSTDWDERHRAAELVWSAEPNRFFAEEVSRMRPGRARDLADVNVEWVTAGLLAHQPREASFDLQVLEAQLREVLPARPARLQGWSPPRDRP